MKKNRLLKLSLGLLLLLFFTQNNLTSAFGQPLSLTSSQPDPASAIPTGMAYLQTQINPDGGLRWAAEDSSMAATLRAILAQSAAGFSQNILTSEDSLKPIDYLSENARMWVFQEASDTPGFSVARAGQLLTAVAAANENPDNFGPDGLKLIRHITLAFETPAGIYGGATADNITDQAWAMIGLAANNAPVPEEAAAWLTRAQSEDGSWNDGFGSYLDTTPLGILALLSSGHTSAESPSIQSALTFMLEHQQAAGGWQNEWDTNTNANTTAAMLQVIHLLGQQPTDELWEQPEGNPQTALLAVQGPDGAFGGDFANAFSTADAIIALSGRVITDLGYLEIASDSFNYLFAEQQADGSWGSVGQTIDVLLALRAAGWQPDTVVNEGSSPVVFIAKNLPAYLETGPDAIGKAILGLQAAGENPQNFNNIDLVRRLLDTYDEATWAFGKPDNTWHQAMAILGLHAVGAELPAGVAVTLQNLQQKDGGWEYTPGFGTAPDNTSLAIQALLAAGTSPEGPHISAGVDFLRSQQTPDGGWGNASSTAYALMALHALKQSQADWVTATGKIPTANLLSYQKPNGAFVYNWEFTDDNLMATASALMALFHKSYLAVDNSEPNMAQAAILIIPGEGGSTMMDCVAFEGQAISGLTLLDQSIFDYTTQDGFISHINAVGNIEGETYYWSYWSWDGRQWVFKNSSAADSQVLPGSVEAWFFTSWDVFPSYPPDIIPDFKQICGSGALKAYSSQPYLDYNDLFNVDYPRDGDLPEVQATPGEANPTDLLNQQASPTPRRVGPTAANQPAPAETEEKSNSPMPLFLIAGFGALVLVTVYLILRKNRP